MPPKYPEAFELQFYYCLLGYWQKSEYQEIGIKIVKFSLNDIKDHKI